MIETSAIQVERAARGFVLTARLWLPKPPEAIFPFFADAFNLEKLTPPWMRFTVLTPRPIEMRAGTRIDYRLRVRGIPLRWQSEITAWEPPTRFVDEMRVGPYRRWRHVHTFAPHDDGAWVEDRVEYDVPGGRLVHGLLVGPDLRRIWTYRENALLELFGEAPERADRRSKIEDPKSR